LRYTERIKARFPETIVPVVDGGAGERLIEAGGASRRSLACLVAACLSLLLLASPEARGASLPSGFQDTDVFSELLEPTALRFSPDGRAFVAEKSGKIFVYDSLSDTTPTEFADLSAKVYDRSDRGLLGLALDPNFATNHYVYVLYAYDHELGEPGEGPRWSDGCPNPPGEANGCVISGRLARLTAEGDHAVGEEKVLVEGWCQQFGSHSIGDLQFDSSGALYASGGEGANFNSADYGQFGYPQANPCDDPPAGIGGAESPPTAEGGALRAQDVRTPGDPTGLSGSVIRIDPETGEGLPGNPMYGSSDKNARRIIAYGFRNPFRFSIDPTTHEVYVNNVGWESYEEIDRFAATPSQAFNSGWPCYEGPEVTPIYSSLGLDVCEDLYEHPSATAPPFFYYNHTSGVMPGDPCPFKNGSAITGSTFYNGGAFPASYEGAYFFADSVRGCVYVMFPGKDGRPDPSTVAPFMSDAGLYPGVDLEVGPEGDLYYVSLFGNEYGPGGIHRISYSSDNQPPVAHLTVDHQWSEKGDPLEAEFDASGSTDADGEPLKYEWDLNGDGEFNDAPDESAAAETYSDEKNHTVAVRVTDEHGASSVARVTVYPGDTPPEPEIVAPSEELKWSVGQEIYFEGAAEDSEEEGGVLPSTSLDWSARLYHCPSSGCHAHPLQAFPAVDSGNLVAPDHDYPSWIELTLTATDSRGLSATSKVKIDPQAVALTIASNPPGLSLGAGDEEGAAPFPLTAIEGSHILLSAPLTQQLGGKTYTWTGWSDGGARVHTIIAENPATYEAFYTAPETPVPPAKEPPPPLQPPSPIVSIMPPQTLLDRHPNKKTSASTAKFVFSSEPAGASFRCKLDRKPFKVCGSPLAFSHLKPGGHVLEVDAVDASGITDSTPATFKWTVLPTTRRPHH
jgi:glucose/arabinose dehydrogenase